MVVLKTNTPNFYNDLCDVLRLYFDVRKIPMTDDVHRESYAADVHLEMLETGVGARVVLYQDGGVVSEHREQEPMGKTKDPLAEKRIWKRTAKIALYRCLRKHFGYDKPWGSLTGIRPTKLLRDTIARAGEGEARRAFLETYDVTEPKYMLARQICGIQAPIIESVGEREIDLYVGIPFCVSRCAYCSFYAAPTSRDGSVEEAYVDALEAEFGMLRELLSAHEVRAVYIGGGTPTAISAPLLKRVLELAAPYGGDEFTVEAGRPDTITHEKLSMMKACGVTRISINPQTTCEETLPLIGRSHTVEEFHRVAALAQKTGFDVVNMDLIAGLPGETVDVFLQSVKDVLAMEPQNITVHSLAIKRASTFGMIYANQFASMADMEAMLEGARELLKEKGYFPYYMYRQKYMAGSMENTGYATAGSICTYNIDMMEETTSILALGAGAASKRVYANENRIARYMGVKDVTQYLARLEELGTRKKALFDFA